VATQSRIAEPASGARLGAPRTCKTDGLVLPFALYRGALLFTCQNGDDFASAWLGAKHPATLDFADALIDGSWESVAF
jgi:hypothetical protein